MQWYCGCQKSFIYRYNENRSIPSTNPVLLDEFLVSNFAPCEKIKKPVRQLTDITKKRPARPSLT